MKILKWGTKTTENYVSSLHGGTAAKARIEGVVRCIIRDVRAYGDKALLQYTRKYDFPEMKASEFRVAPGEIIEAYGQVDRSYLCAVDRLIDRITRFEKRSLRKSWMRESDGVILGKYVRPLEGVGIYVPAGKAAYPSSLIMCAVPARLAGVGEIVIVSPPDRKGKIDPHIIVAANKLSIKRMYKAGGAQAIAALAYGTKIIPGVDKIVGPGNIYVAVAKKLLFGEIDIDTIAGPSEIVVLADKDASPSFIAADMLSQAEHGTGAVCICLTPSLTLARAVLGEVDIQKAGLKRKRILNSSLKEAVIILTRDMSEAVDVANSIAPEHLEVLTKNPFDVLPKVKNAGAIFLGEYSPVAIGDYAAGPSHVLPTEGTSKFFSPLSVVDFLKESNVISSSKDGFKKLVPTAVKFAEIEGLDAHLNALKIREKKTRRKR